jgi:hypothetical protein
MHFLDGVYLLFQKMTSGHQAFLDGGYVVIQKTLNNHQAFSRWHLCNDAKNV